MFGTAVPAPGTDTHSRDARLVRIHRRDGPAPLRPRTVARPPTTQRQRGAGEHDRRPPGGSRAHTGCMSRMIWTILGAILALWLAFTAIGWMVAMLKTFFIIGLIAVVVVIVVWLLAGRARRDNAAR